MSKKLYKTFLIALFAKHQSGISFNAARESSTASSHIFWVIRLSGQYTIKKDVPKQLCYIFLELYIDQEQNQIQKTSINRFITHFLSVIVFRNIFYCRRMSINSFIAHFFILLAFRNKFSCMSVTVNCFITHSSIFVAVRNRV